MKQNQFSGAIQLQKQGNLIYFVCVFIFISTEKKSLAILISKTIF